MFRTKNVNPVMSYKNLRRLIGILGMFLPGICYFGGSLFSQLSLQPSISYYYHTNVRDAFLGLMIGVAMFMTTYKGYEKIDNIVSNIIGFAGMGIAIFPCLFSNTTTTPVGLFQIAPKVSNILHIASAGIFFVLLAINSIFIFTMTTDKKTMTENKKKRNAIYIGCGIIILLAISSLVIIQLIIDPVIVDEKRIVFIFETILLEAFGISWLVKGETIFRDK